MPRVLEYQQIPGGTDDPNENKRNAAQKLQKKKRRIMASHDNRPRKTKKIPQTVTLIITLEF